MKEQNIVTKQELVRLFNHMKEAKNIEKNSKFFENYTIYICEEEKIIPLILNQLYCDKKLSISESARLLLCYKYFKLHSSEKDREPTFLNEKFKPREKIYAKAIEKMDKRITYKKRYHKEMPQWDMIYDIDYIHELLLKALEDSNTL